MENVSFMIFIYKITPFLKAVSSGHGFYLLMEYQTSIRDYHTNSKSEIKNMSIESYLTAYRNSFQSRIAKLHCTFHDTNSKYYVVWRNNIENTYPFKSVGFFMVGTLFYDKILNYIYFFLSIYFYDTFLTATVASVPELICKLY